MTIRVVFVCLGNICRSPMAHGLFAHLVKEAGLDGRIEVDSCGTGSWHVGEPPHRDTQRILERHGIQLHHHARQIERADLEEADYLIALDRSNLADLQLMEPKRAEVGLLLDYAPDVPHRDVPDPYYTGRFEEVFEMVEAGCRGLLAYIRQREGF